MSIKPNECTGAWDCVVKIAKFILWAGAIPASVGIIGWRLGVLNDGKKNEFDRAARKI